MREVKIAMVQFNSKIGNMADNVERGQEYICQAAEKGADIIVFPEFFACGYNTEYLREHKEELALDEKNVLVRQMADTARACNINVVMPCIQKDGDNYYNGEYLFNRQGEICGAYKKVHLWAEEAKIFEKGTEYPVFDLDFGKLGLLICYDAGFPEAARMLALKGAEIILVSGAFCGIHKKRWDTYYGARALENTLYVGAVNATGGTGEEIWFGNNYFFDINGEKLAEGILNTEEMQIVTADLDRVKEIRDAGCYLTDLRMSTYNYKVTS